jgi:hypothetical protein
MGNRPDNGKVGAAIDVVHNEVAKANALYERMSDQQRRVFVSMLKGLPDELQVLVDAGYTHGITTIAKIVYLKDGSPLETKKLCKENINELDPSSYERLLRIAVSEVKNIIGTRDYKDYITDVKSLFKLVAPEALTTLVEIATDPLNKPADRRLAATALLDRGGYGASQTNNKDDRPPVMVQINFDKAPRAEVNPNVIVVNPEDINNG